MFATPNCDKNYENLWISEYYCPNWRHWEAFRELLQNQFDKIVSIIGDKDLVEVIPKNKYIYQGITYGFEFDFKSTKENDNTIYGSIKYDRSNNRTLIIQNEGNLDKADLLMGGKGEKSKKDNDQIIGMHGEGLKLAALAFVRGDEKEKIDGKDFRIYTNKEMWHFKLVEDERFLPDKDKDKKKIIKVLKVNISPHNKKEYENKVTVEISPIDLENEWIKYLDRILWLIKWQKDEKLNLCTIKAVDKNGKNFGEIFLNERFRDRIYVKDIFVQDFHDLKEKDITSLACFFGFNVNMELDRDRNAIKDLDKRNILFSEILANILRRRNEINRKLDNELTYSKFKDYLKHVVFLIQRDYVMIRHILDLGNIGQQEKNDIWDYLEDEIFKQQEYGPIKKIQMLHSPYIGSLNAFLNEHKLPKEFYPYHKIDSWLTWNVLTANPPSSYYKSYKTLYEEKIKNNKNIVPEPLALKDTLDKISEKLKNCHSNFKREYIKFKKFDFDFENNDPNDDPRDKIVGFDNNIIYFSDSLQNNITNEKKNWIFKMIVDKYKIDLFELC